MKARFALVALMSVVAAPLAAQGGMRMGGQLNIESLGTMYSLSAEQKSSTEALLKTYNASTMGVQAWMTKMRESGDMAAMRTGPGAADSMKKMTDARAKFDADFKAILIGTQVAKFDSVATARAARMQARP